jgi:large subunit ribosomal protein L24
MTHKMKIKKGDTVRILRGRDRGKTGKVLAVAPQEAKLLVESVNMVKKHIRPRRAGEKGQRVTVAAFLPAANAQVVCGQCKKGTRVLMKREGDNLVRVCRHCGAPLSA